MTRMTTTETMASMISKNQTQLKRPVCLSCLVYSESSTRSVSSCRGSGRFFSCKSALMRSWSLVLCPLSCTSIPTNVPERSVPFCLS